MFQDLQQEAKDVYCVVEIASGFNAFTSSYRAIQANLSQLGFVLNELSSLLSVYLPGTKK